jgi:hypothetical protein
MTRVGADAVDVANVPLGLPIYCAYDDGTYANVNAMRARVGPDPIVWSITVNPGDDFGDWLDVEKYDADPAQAPPWIVARRAKHPNPGCYCSEAIWDAVKAAFLSAGVPEPPYWIAGYPGSAGAGNLYPGCAGHQWIDHNNLWDESVWVDYIPGLDPAPTPPPIPPVPPTQQENETVCVIETGGLRHVFGTVNNVAYHWWQSIAGPDFAWNVEKLPVPA